MSQYNDTGERAFATDGAEAIPRYSRVKLSSGVLRICNAGEVGIGIARNGSWATGQGAGEPVTVLLWNKPGTHPMIAGETLAAGDAVVTSANGRCVKSPGQIGSFQLGRVITGATEVGAVVEVLRIIDAIT